MPNKEKRVRAFDTLASDLLAGEFERTAVRACYTYILTLQGLA